MQQDIRPGGATCSPRWPETLDPEKGASRPEKGASRLMKTDRDGGGRPGAHFNDLSKALPGGPLVSTDVINE